MPTEYITRVGTDTFDYASHTTLITDMGLTNWTLSTTKVFSGTLTGTVSAGDTVTGATSGATGTVIANWTGSQLGLRSISGTFQAGERAEVDASNYVTLSDAGDSVTYVLEFEPKAGGYSGDMQLFNQQPGPDNRTIVRLKNSARKPPGYDTQYQILGTNTTLNQGNGYWTAQDIQLWCGFNDRITSSGGALTDIVIERCTLGSNSTNNYLHSCPVNAVVQNNFYRMGGTGGFISANVTNSVVQHCVFRDTGGSTFTGINGLLSAGSMNVLNNVFLNVPNEISSDPGAGNVVSNNATSNATFTRSVNPVVNVSLVDGVDLVVLNTDPNLPDETSILFKAGTANIDLLRDANFDFYNSPPSIGLDDIFSGVVGGGGGGSNGPWRFTVAPDPAYDAALEAAYEAAG